LADYFWTVLCAGGAIRAAGIFVTYHERIKRSVKEELLF
jgi:hypothetical protein